MEGIGDGPFCSLFINTMLYNNGPFLKKPLRINKALKC